jgi:hypothetical protein
LGAAAHSVTEEKRPAVSHRKKAAPIQWHRHGIGLAALLFSCCAARPDGPELLAHKRYRQLLNTVRPADIASQRLRARALLALGDLDAARAELRVALVREGDDVQARQILALVERRAGNRGAELEQLEQLVSANSDDKRTKRRLAQLLLERAAIQQTRRFGLRNPSAAKADLERAAQLDQRIAAVLPRLQRGEQIDGITTQPLCPGVPTIDWLRPLPEQRCLLDHPQALLSRSKARFVLSACGDASVALQLEGGGCLAHAERAWDRLRAFRRADPRWPLALARLALTRRRLGHALQLLLDYRYFAPDRAKATLLSARLLTLAGFTRHAARMVVEAIALTSKADTQLEAVNLLIRLGRHDAARQAAEVILARSATKSGQRRAALERQLTRLLAQSRAESQPTTAPAMHPLPAHSEPTTAPAMHPLPAHGEPTTAPGTHPQRTPAR